MLINRWEPRVCRELSKRAPALNSFLIHINPYYLFLLFFFSMAGQPDDPSSGVVRFPSVQPCGNTAARDADGVDRIETVLRPYSDTEPRAVYTRLALFFVLPGVLPFS